MDHKEIFARLWEIYTRQNPDTKKVYDLLKAEGENVVNDHVAFRTFDDPRINVDVLARAFTDSGYEFRGDYHFPQKKLYAKHYEHTSDTLAPRVFISQLLTGEFSEYLRSTVTRWVDAIPAGILASKELIFSGNLSGQPSFEIFERLRIESEYAAWLYVNGFCANHFTVSVNNLNKYNSIVKVNSFLKHHGFQMNNAGGEIQGTPEELLEQSSIKAGIMPFTFADGTYDIPGCYYEFARRYPDSNGKLYSGFIAKSADRIFQSTDFYKK
jgi:hypothetical protein